MMGGGRVPPARVMGSGLWKVTISAAVAAAFLTAPACGADPDALRRIVQEECVAHWTGQHDPAPCAEVAPGYAVLADRKGGAHFLLIPTRNIIGIESPELLSADALNYLALAWGARGRLASVVGHGIPRNAVGLAVNPVRARSQTQLHIHIECLRPDVFAALDRDAEKITADWTPERVGGAEFEALKVSGEDLGDHNPFKMLSERASREHRGMGDYTLIVAGSQSKSGPGFIVLAGTAAAGELLLDSTCAAAKGT